MSNQSRKHHYVPKFYLAGFTDDGTVEGRLSVLDTNRLKVWTSKPLDVAHQRDFYEVSGGPNRDPMSVEKLLAKCESKWSSVLRDVIEQQHLPNDDRFSDLMMFVAFMAVRVPRIRNTIDSFLDEVRRKDEFARHWLQQQGQHAEPAYDDQVDECDQTWHVQRMIQMAMRLAPELHLRTWRLWIVNPGAPDLFCSDSPISLNWATADPGPYPPGFGLRSTVVSIPLHKRLALVGMIDVDVGRRLIETIEVARLNSATGMHAGQIYSPAPDFTWLMTNGSVGGRSDLMDALRTSNS